MRPPVLAVQPGPFALMGSLFGQIKKECVKYARKHKKPGFHLILLLHIVTPSLGFHPHILSVSGLGI